MEDRSRWRQGADDWNEKIPGDKRRRQNEMKRNGNANEGKGEKSWRGREN